MFLCKKICLHYMACILCTYYLMTACLEATYAILEDWNQYFGTQLSSDVVFGYFDQ